MRFGECMRERLALQIAVQERDAVVEDRRMISAAQVRPREMPRTVEIHEIFWSRRLVISALTLVDEWRDAVIPRPALVHHRRVDTAQRLPPDKRCGIGRKREHRLHPRILPSPPCASEA